MNEKKILIPDVGIIFEYNDHKYRITSWLKEIYDPPNGNIFDTIIFKSSFTNKNNNKFIYCSREEATYVSGTGIAGCIVNINEIIIIGRVSWSERRIDELRDSAIKRIGRVVF